MIAGSMRATAVERAGCGPFCPRYQKTVLAAVPATCAVAVAKGGPATRCGGLPKKSFPAATAEAADREVCANCPIPAVMAAFRLAAVATEVAPMVNCPGPGGAEAVACSVRVSLDPSGKAN